MKYRERTIKHLVIMLAGAATASAYFAGVLQTIFSSYGVSLRPSIVIASIRERGFPGGLFVLILCALSFLIIYGYFVVFESPGGNDKLGRRFSRALRRQVYGDAHFEEPEEYVSVARIEPPERAVGTILGQIDDSGTQLINLIPGGANRLNQHIAVAGASGSGKTYTFSKPYCFQTIRRRESIILTDPDGGLYRDMAGYFEDNGYVVRRFDLNDLDKSDGWHCLKSVKQDELNAQLFAETVITNIVDKPDSVYGQGPLSLLKALILRVALGEDYSENEKNLKSVYGLLQMPGGETMLDELFDADTLSKKERPCVGPYLAFKQASPNLRGNIITNLAVQLQVLQNEMVCKVLSTDDVDLELPAKQPCAYFCIFPDSHKTYRFIVSLFFSMLFTTLTSYADNTLTGRCDIPVNFLMEELPSIGAIPDFDSKIATVRKRSMNIAMVYQDITQLQNRYPDTWVTLLANCSTMLCLGVNDEFTADMVTKRIGETTVEVQTQQHNDAQSMFAAIQAYSTGEGRRALLSLDEVMKVGADDCVILFQGHNPVFARKYPYTLHPAAKSLRQIPKSDIPSFHDTAKRAERRELEADRIARCNKKYPLENVDRSYAVMEEVIIVEPWHRNVKNAVLRKVKWLKQKVREGAGREVEGEFELVEMEWVNGDPRNMAEVPPVLSDVPEEKGESAGDGIDVEGGDATSDPMETEGECCGAETEERHNTTELQMEATSELSEERPTTFVFQQVEPIKEKARESKYSGGAPPKKKAR